jgi:uncharacterized membrane protein
MMLASGRVHSVSPVQKEEESMADLVAIGYPDEATAARAAAEAERLAADLMIEPDAITAITCDEVAAGVDALFATIEETGIDRQFADQLRELIQAGTSALFLVVEKVAPDKAVEALAPFGGTVLKSSLSKDAERELRTALRGVSVTA